MGKGGDATSRSSSADEKPVEWIKISGKYYDVTNFRHPGGNIIDLFKGMVRRKEEEKPLFVWWGRARAEWFHRRER